ncbi:MAG: hypothetical protein ABGX04_17825 [Myxococcales bacterium]|nr:hypothetical protein [Myxococcales bacterium]HIK86469.1 hypothetical protein [Myxococcales bacterium]
MGDIIFQPGGELAPRDAISERLVPVDHGSLIPPEGTALYLRTVVRLTGNIENDIDFHFLYEYDADV